MIADVIALAPPVIMATAFLIGVGWFLRSQMRSDQGSRRQDCPDDIPAEKPECAAAAPVKEHDSARRGH